MARVGPVDPEKDVGLASGEVAVFEPARDHVMIGLGHGGGDDLVRVVLEEGSRVVSRDGDPVHDFALNIQFPQASSAGNVERSLPRVVLWASRKSGQGDNLEGRYLSEWSASTGVRLDLHVAVRPLHVAASLVVHEAVWGLVSRQDPVVYWW